MSGIGFPFLRMHCRDFREISDPRSYRLRMTSFACSSIVPSGFCFFPQWHSGARHNFPGGEFTEYYNRVRSHTERDHLPPIHAPPDEVPMLETKQIVVKSYVGGLVKSFQRKAA